MKNDELMGLFYLAVICWGLLLIFSHLFPHKLFNSVLLAAALGFTMLFVVTVFTVDLVTALFITFIAAMIVLLLVPWMLIVNGITMMKKEGRSVANLLSLLMGIVIEIGELAFIVNIIFNYSMGIEFFRKMDAFLLFVGMSVFYFSFLILLFVLYVIWFQLIPHFWNYEYIIIHGCGLLKGNKVSRLLSNRIDKAISIFRKGHGRAMLICSGGQGADETVSEAEAIAGYLREKGIPEDHIILEDRSKTTEENLAYSRQIIESRGGSRRIALISSNYHVYRCVLLAHDMKFRATGIGARVALYYWPSAVLREFAAVHSEKHRLFWITVGYILFLSPYLYLLVKS
ncbi:MAG: YdcF family protein [Erysipelotrichaceae bacterium]|nr:YdcF family protein [Erysipelotrichaceae bacterium]